MNVPKLRFKEFNDEWKIYNFYDVVIIKNGQVNPNDEKYRNLPHIGPGNIEKETGRLLKYNLVKDDRLISSKYLFSDNDIIYGKINPHFAKVCFPNFRGLCSADAYPITPIRDYLVPNFLLYLLLNKRFTRFATSVSMRTGMPKINRDELGAYEFKIPSLQEQEKIGTFLSLLDKKIELQSKKIETLKLYKKSLNNKIFKINEEEKSIKDVVIEYNKRTLQNNQYEILSSTMNGIVIQNNYFNKKQASEDTTGYKIVPNGYITYRSMSDTGEFHFNIQNVTEVGIVSPAYPVFITTEDVDKNYFLNYINENTKFKNLILSRKEGGTRYALSFSKFKCLKICLPDLQTQKYLGNVVSIINRKITIEENKMSKLSILKKGLMQNMFV